MSTDPAPSPRRALAGLPPRNGRPTAGVARLIRSNRADEPDATEAAPAELLGSRSTSPVVDPQAHGGTESQSPGVPKYLQLVRREARMHSGQVSELANLTRALNEARRGGGRSGVGERITDNTLVRVAVDLLLQDPQRLRGTTEDELRASVGLPPLEQATQDQP
ncbi:hypothetical protein [uncultured Pseudokineococcus sp.]|uniref:hypothetical protein n=1 Tax=uncultured Pseudokineococcus sp. TaxID=1642928 RepID=UPI00262A9CFC|nr:hypothetical protein [uncultured Pseudokineococcus sp.]